MNKLRKVFNDDPPDPNDPFVKWVEETIRKSHEEKWCTSCKHCVPVDPGLTGYVTAYPTCEFRGVDTMRNCDKYEEEISLEDELKQLYGETQGGNPIEEDGTNGGE